MQEKERLTRAVTRTAEAMESRLFEKFDEGFSGWDDESTIPTKNLLWRAHAKLVIMLEDDEFISKKDCIDICNFMMMVRERVLKREQLGREQNE
jgi:hypothetical protein